MEQFTHLYPLNKTLRFKLIPIGETLVNINRKELITKDCERSKNYKMMKDTIDEFHRHFIDLALKNVKLSYLEDFSNLYYLTPEQKKEQTFLEEMKKVQTKLRKEIVNGFKTGDIEKIFKKLDKKELFTELLPEWISRQEEEIYFNEEFKNFTTYFRGFNENRMNMYSEKAQTTSIAYRLIHENLPRFLDNIKIYEKIKSIPELKEKCVKLHEELSQYIAIPHLDSIFQVNYFNEILLQKQIDIFNSIIGGVTVKEKERKIQGLNEYINLYNQQQPDKSGRIPKMKLFYKQILSDREKVSFRLDKFSDSEEVLAAIKIFYQNIICNFRNGMPDESENILDKLVELLGSMREYDLSRIYFRNDVQLTKMSQKIFDDYAIIENALKYYYENVMQPDYQKQYYEATKKERETLEKEREKFLSQSFLSIALIKDALNCYVPSLDESHEVKRNYDPDCITEYFNLQHRNGNSTGKETPGLISAIGSNYIKVKDILESYPSGQDLYKDKPSVDLIKQFFDSILELYHFVRPLIIINDQSLEKESLFYNELEPRFESLKEVIPLYNKVRNYATQKPYSTEKFKMNFENSTLLNGWDKSKEKDYTGLLFVKEGFYYLGIMDKQHNNLFMNPPIHTSTEAYSKINYKQLQGVNKQLPRIIFAQRNIDFYNPSEEILRIRNHGTHTKNGEAQEGYEKLEFNLEDCRKMIDFYKASIDKNPDWKVFNFNFSPTNTYNSIDEFYREVEEQGYSIMFTEIDKAYIDKLISEGKLYLFKIFNKDFSEYSKGKSNLHTLYWKALFEEENLRNVVYKLNGGAEIFFRESSIEKEEIVIHKANEEIKNKNPLSTKTHSTFPYDLIKDRRYTYDHFQFHVPITLNFKSRRINNINPDVLKYLKGNKEVNIIGIDRGERNLIYMTIINQNGEILHQESLNYFRDEQKDIVKDYHALLVNREKERDQARRNWGTIEKIKDLKEGYISQIIHKIASLMVQYNAILVMEDLNIGFKRGRFKVERQVYQKFEKMLIDKLNYLVFKDKSDNEPGGRYNALQLTNHVTTLGEVGKQCGFLFYVPAWNTSKIDPTTGFVNFFKTRYESVEKSKEFFSRFDSIRYNAERDYFEFAFDYSQFTAKAEGTKTHWTVCTYGERILTFRNPENNHQWDYKKVSLTEELSQLLRKFHIDFKDGNCLKNKISGISDSEFFRKLIHLFGLTMQMRNSNSNDGEDFIISPVKNLDGNFYLTQNKEGVIPEDADANGAYHIAKKGLWWLEQINKFSGTDWKKLKFDISNKGWLQFAQKHTLTLNG